MHLSSITWAILGLVLIGIEIASFSFVLLFFGIAALLVAGAKLLGLNHLPVEITIFGVGGLAGLLLFRRKMIAGLKAHESNLTDQHNTFILNADIPAHGRQTVEYQGSQWTAINESEEELKQGQTVVIVKTDGIKLILKRKS